MDSRYRSFKSLLVFFFYWNVGYLTPKPSLQKNSSGNPKLEMIRGFNTFPKGISSKVNVMPRLEFELVYHNVEVFHVKHSSTFVVDFLFKVKSIFQSAALIEDKRFSPTFD